MWECVVFGRKNNIILYEWEFNLFYSWDNTKNAHGLIDNYKLFYSFTIKICVLLFSFSNKQYFPKKVKQFSIWKITLREKQIYKFIFKCHQYQFNYTGEKEVNEKYAKLIHILRRQFFLENSYICTRSLKEAELSFHCTCFALVQYIFITFMKLFWYHFCN